MCLGVDPQSHEYKVAKPIVCTHGAKEERSRNEKSYFASFSTFYDGKKLKNKIKKNAERVKTRQTLSDHQS